MQRIIQLEKSKYLDFKTQRKRGLVEDFQMALKELEGVRTTQVSEKSTIS